MNKSIIAALAFAGLLLQSGCTSTALLSGDGTDRNKPVFDSIDTAKISENYLIDSKKVNPLVFIQGGFQNDILYSNFNNPLKIFVEGASPENFIVSARGGSLDTINKKKGLFQFYDSHNGTLIEIVVEDTISGVVVGKSFDVVPIPAPTAYVWKSMTSFRNKYSFNAKEFKLQNALLLSHENISIPILCGASSYLIVRIDTKGKRLKHLNTDVSGVYDSESQKIIAAAQKDDVYIFKDIKSDCSSAPIKNIVYIIE